MRTVHHHTPIVDHGRRNSGTRRFFRNDRGKGGGFFWGGGGRVLRGSRHCLRRERALFLICRSSRGRYGSLSGRRLHSRSVCLASWTLDYLSCFGRFKLSDTGLVKGFDIRLQLGQPPSIGCFT